MFIHNPNIYNIYISVLTYELFLQVFFQDFKQSTCLLRIKYPQEYFPEVTQKLAISKFHIALFKLLVLI